MHPNPDVNFLEDLKEELEHLKGELGTIPSEANERLTNLLTRIHLQIEKLKDSD
jgi:hypothetical protein